MKCRKITIINKLGMHARASAKFVSLASAFDSEITLARNGQRVNGKSIMGIMMLAAEQGAEIVLEIEGDDAEECLEALSAVLNADLEEEG